MADMDSDMTSEKYDWFDLILTAFIFIVLGYVWAWHHGKIQLERAYDKGYEAAVEELIIDDHESTDCGDKCRFRDDINYMCTLFDTPFTEYYLKRC